MCCPRPRERCTQSPCPHRAHILFEKGDAEGLSHEKQVRQQSEGGERSKEKLKLERCLVKYHQGKERAINVGRNVPISSRKQFQGKGDNSNRSSESEVFHHWLSNISAKQAPVVCRPSHTGTVHLQWTPKIPFTIGQL